MNRFLFTGLLAGLATGGLGGGKAGAEGPVPQGEVALKLEGVLANQSRFGVAPNNIRAAAMAHAATLVPKDAPPGELLKMLRTRADGSLPGGCPRWHA